MLKLVSTEGQAIIEPPLADEIHAFADALEAGDHGDAVGVISAVVQADGAIKICWFGEDYTPYELMGLFEAAKLRVFANDVIEDDK